MSNIIRTYCCSILSLYVLWRVWKTLPLSACVRVCAAYRDCDCNSNQIAKRTFHSAQQFLFLWPPPSTRHLEQVPFKKEAWSEQPDTFHFRWTWNRQGAKVARKLRTWPRMLMIILVSHPTILFSLHNCFFFFFSESSKQSRTDIKMLRRKRWRR